MADIMNQVEQGVGTGIQPKDNPSPVAPSPSASAQITEASLPPGSGAMPRMPASQPDASMPVAPTPAPTAAPAPPQSNGGGDKDVDDLFSDFSKQPQPKAAKDHADNMQGDVDGLFKDFGGGAAPKKDVSAWGKLVDSLPESVRLTAANMRAQLGRDPKEQRQAFESMFGAENVKTVGKDLLFRPNGKGAFTKVNKTVYGGLIDFALSHALQVPGLAANIATQGATDAATGASGPLGFAVGGAAGGAAGAVVDAGMRGVLNQVSSEPQDDARESLKSTIAKEAGLNAVGAGVLGPIIGQIGKAWSKVRDGVVAAGGEEIGKLAAVRTAFNEFRDVVFPHATEGSAQSSMTAVDAIQKRMSDQVGAIKDEALGLAKTKDLNSPMDSTIGKLKDILQQNGYYFDEKGIAKPITNNRAFAYKQGAGGDELASSSYSGALDTLANYQNRLVNDKTFKGTDPTQLLQDIDNLTRKAKFDKASPANSDVLNLFKQVRNAASSDRNALFENIYKGSGSPSEGVWKNTFDEYNHNIDAVTDLQAAFRTPEQREMMVNTLNKSSSPDKLELLDNFKQVLGEGSKEWNSLRGEIYGQIINNHIGENGAFQAGKFADYLTNKVNQPFLSRLLPKEDQAVLTRMAVESSQVNANNSLTAPQANRMREAASNLISLLGDKMGVNAIFKLTSGNAKIINYLTDDGFMEAYAKAQGPELKQNILNAKRLMGGLRDKMNIIDIPTLAQRTAKSAQRYVPLAAPGGASVLDKMTGTGFKPAAAPASMPAPAPTPQPNSQGIAFGQ